MLGLLAAMASREEGAGGVAATQAGATSLASVAGGGGRWPPRPPQPTSAPAWVSQPLLHSGVLRPNERPKVEDKGKEVISPTFSLFKPEK